MQVIERKVKNRISSNGRGWCFTPKKFLDLGKEDAIHQALSRLKNKGFIKRLTWGLYEYPQTHPKLGELPPSLDRVIDAITEKGQLRCQPSGAYALNLLDLSEQVPAKVVLLTDGASKTIKIGHMEIIFKKTTPKSMRLAGTTSGLVIQALKFLGKHHVNEKIMHILERRLTKEDKKRLCLDCNLAPVWIADIVKNYFMNDIGR